MDKSFWVGFGCCLFIVAVGIMEYYPQIADALYSIPPTRAFDHVHINNNNTRINASSSAGHLGISQGTGIAISVGTHNDIIIEATGLAAGTWESLSNVTDTFCTTNQVRKAVGNQWVCADDNTGAGALNDLTDVTITSVAYGHILQYSQAVGQWVNKLFRIDTQTPAVDFQIIGINNQTGAITTNQFSVNTVTSPAVDFQVYNINNVTGQVTTNQFSVNSLTCGGTDKISSINNVTGQITCTTDSTGAGASDIISEGNSNVEVIDAGTGEVQIDIDGTNEFRFLTNLFDMVGASFNNAIFDVAGTGNRLTSTGTALGDILKSDGTDFKRLARGTNGQVLTSTSTDISWQTPAAGGSGIPLPTTKKYGHVIPGDATPLGVGMLEGSTFGGTEAFGDDADGARISTTTGTTAGTDAGVQSANGSICHREWNCYLDARVQEAAITTHRLFVGFHSAATLPNSDTTMCDSGSCFGFWTQSGSTIVQNIRNDGDATADETATALTENTSVHRYEVYAKASTNEFCYQIDDAAEVCFSTEIPAATTDLFILTVLETSDATSDTFEYYYVYTENDR